MLEVLKLKNPINGPDGTEITELEYDVEKIKLSVIDKILGEADPGGQTSLRFGIAAILAVNPKLIEEDLQNIRGRDCMEILQIGGNFIQASGGSRANSSEEQSETTAGRSTQA